MHLNPLYDQKTGLGQPTQFWKNFWNAWVPRRGIAVSDGSNQSQNVTGYEIVAFDKIQSRDGALEHFEKKFYEILFLMVKSVVFRSKHGQKR